MQSQQKINIFWFRRDLRLHDNTGLLKALVKEIPVLPLFIFDPFSIDSLEKKEDPRITFVYDEVCSLHQELKTMGSGLLIKKGEPLEIIRSLAEEYSISAVFANKEYEPSTKERDDKIGRFLQGKGIEFHAFKDQVIFEGKEILSKSGDAYKVFTPYSKVWLNNLEETQMAAPTTTPANFLSESELPDPPSLESLGFKRSQLIIPDRNISTEIISHYHQNKDYPFLEGTSRLGIHLRYGTISIRNLVTKARQLNEKFLLELIWREFYMMILDQNPQVITQAYKPKYDRIPWRNNEEDFNKWCQGKTGIPLVDAGMRQLNSSGFMHNRLRMITASFLTKNLMIDWRWGEAYFAEKLLDYELSSNNGGWQWAAGSGVDAQPYFRIFNPATQAKTWDPEKAYIKQWIPELDTTEYPEPMVDLKESRKLAIATFKKYLDG